MGSCSQHRNADTYQRRLRLRAHFLTPDQQSAENIEAKLLVLLETAAAKAASKQTPGELLPAFATGEKVR